MERIPQYRNRCPTFKDSVRALCGEIFYRAIRDIRGGCIDGISDDKPEASREDALLWVSENSGEVFGYRFCIRHARLSPNLVNERFGSEIKKSIGGTQSRFCGAGIENH